MNTKLLRLVALSLALILVPASFVAACKGGACGRKKSNVTRIK